MNGRFARNLVITAAAMMIVQAAHSGAAAADRRIGVGALEIARRRYFL